MGLYKGRFMSLALAAFVGVGLVACDDDASEETAEEQQADEAVEAVDVNEDELPFYATGPVARIDGEEIGQDEFNAMVQERMERLPGQLPPQMAEMFKEQSLDFVVDKHLVDQVLADQDIEVTDEEIDEAFEEFKTRFGGDDEIIQAQLDQMGMTEDDVRENMEQDVMLEKHLATMYDLEVTEQEIEEFYQQNQERFSQDEQVKASHILIEVDENADEETEADALQRAEEVYEEATGGADFAELAEAKSEGPTASRGGDLGFFPRQQMVPEFADVAFDELEVDEISEPVRSQFGYHVIKKTDHREAGDMELADVSDDIEMQLVHQKRQESFHEFLEELKSDIEIEKLEDNIVMNVEAPEGQGQPMMPHGGGHDHDHDHAHPQQVQPVEGGDGEAPTIELEDGQELELELEQPDLGDE